MSPLPWTISKPDAYGQIPAGFSFTVESGYTTLVGRNNAGKSTILQWLFALAIGANEFGRDGAALLIPDRGVVSASVAGAGDLAALNDVFASNVRHGPLPYHSFIGYQRDALFSALVAHTNYEKSWTSMADMVEGLGFPRPKVHKGQQFDVGDLQAFTQGAGLRALLPVLAALADPAIKLILIDEPEISMEPAMQRRVRDLLVTHARDRAIVVATHSHLFLDRTRPNSIRMVTGGLGEPTQVRALADPSDLIELTFRLLGNSVEDLFFPGNFVIVEGASDQAIVQSVRDLMGVDGAKVKVIAAGGITLIHSAVSAVSEVLRPVVTRDSPYARKVVAIIDGPSAPSLIEDEIRRVIGDRLYLLGAPTLEEWLAPEIYAAAGLNKGVELAKIRSAPDVRLAKERLSNTIAAAITTAQLPLLEPIVTAVQRAIGLADS